MLFKQIKKKKHKKNKIYADTETVVIFLQNVLEEIVEMFPGPYIHIGGDEAHKEYWETCPLCQKRIAEKGLDNEHELQSWFIKRIGYSRVFPKKNKNVHNWKWKRI